MVKLKKQQNIINGKTKIKQQNINTDIKTKRHHQKCQNNETLFMVKLKKLQDIIINVNTTKHH